MPDTPRTLAALQALLADNAAGDISEQDIRDFLVSCALITGTGELEGTADAPTVTTVHAGSAHHDEAHDGNTHTGTPGGELGGTWASPTVDTTHSGSTHAAAQAAAEATAAAALAAHDHVGGDGAQIDHDNLANVSANDHHNQAHGTSDHTENGNWKLFYSNGSGDMVELALGADGTFLESNGASSAPAFRALVAADIPARTASMVLTAGGGSPTTTQPCTGPTQVEAGTNDVDYWVLDFPDSGADTRAFWGPILMPDGYDGGTLSAKFVWTAASGSGDVIWGIQMLSVANDEVIDAAYGTAVTVTDTLLATGDVHVSPTASSIEPAGSQAAGELMFIRVYRDGDNASDTLSGTARLICVILEFGSSYSD